MQTRVGTDYLPLPGKRWAAFYVYFFSKVEKLCGENEGNYCATQIPDFLVLIRLTP